MTAYSQWHQNNCPPAPNPPKISLSVVPRHPFLQALSHIDYGSLKLTTPEGQTLFFEGAGEGPAAHMALKDWEVLNEAIAHGEMGFADTYIDEKWESDNLPELIAFALLNTDALEKFFYPRPWVALRYKINAFFNRNSIRGSRRNIAAHYDLGNDFYRLWLDDSMTYSCALFEGDENRTLEEAQQAKYNRILTKLGAKPGDHILEIGCGWGGFAEAAARRGIFVTGVTLSKEQADYAKDRLARTGLNQLAKIEYCDYREVEGQFDYVASIGMFEHVGEKYWPVYFQTVHDRLKPGGKAMIQSITLDDTLFERLGSREGFIELYIFPGGQLPGKIRFCEEAIKAKVECREIFSFGMDYKRTLTEWLKRFDAQIPAVKAMGYSEEFIRLWRFYLASCIGSFAARRTDVMQAELVRSA